MIFKTRVDLFYKLVVVFVFLLFSFILFNINFETDFFGFYFILIIQIIILFFFIGSAFTTKFIISDTELICKTFYWKKSIPLNLIRKVEKQTNLFAGWKISTAYKGVIVHYNKYDELLISPENELGFINELNKHIDKIK
jgi:hypothetical protein